LSVLLLVCVFLAAACTMADTPRRSLDELRTALLNHDADTALLYVDVDSIVENMVRDTLARYEVASDDPLSLLGLEAGRQVASVLMPGVREVARRSVRAAIASSDEAGYFEYVKRGNVWYLTISEQGDAALVKPRGKSDTSFEMKRVAPGRWQIVRIIKEDR
jgi:hypothetical protein